MPKTINVTIRQNPETHDQIKELAARLNTTPAQVYKWLVDAGLEIIEDKQEQAALPATLALMRGLNGGREKMRKETK